MIEQWSAVSYQLSAVSYTARGACMKVFPERDAYVECAAKLGKN